MRNISKNITNQVVKQSFLQGALILTLSVVVVKIVGALYKIPLANVITENGMGYFGSAFSFYGAFYSLASAGFPVAISKMVSENYTLKRFNDVRRIKTISMPIFIVTGLCATVIMIIGAPYYVKFIGNDGALLSALFLAPSLFFCNLSSAYRGYYEGLRNMYPTAYSQVVEAVIKLFVGLVGAMSTVTYCYKEWETSGTVLGKSMSQNEAVLTTYAYASGVSIIGVTIGGLFSFLYLYSYFRKNGDGISVEMCRQAPRPQTKKFLLKKLVAIAVPVGVSSLALTVSALIDSIFLQQSLKNILEDSDSLSTILKIYDGLIPAENLSDPSTISNFLWGCFGNSTTIYMIIPTLTTALALTGLPALTHVWTNGIGEEIKSTMESIFRVTFLVSFPAGMGITALSFQITDLFYSGTGAEITGRILAVLGIASIFFASSIPISSMLQGINRADVPVKILGFALFVKILLNYFLCSVPEINILGAGFATLVCYFIYCVLSVIMLMKITKVKINWMEIFLKPCFCGGVCAFSAYLFSKILVGFGMNFAMSAVPSIAFAVVIYVISLIFTKTITKNDILMLPKGEKFLKILEKKDWIG